MSRPVYENVTVCHKNMPNTAIVQNIPISAVDRLTPPDQILKFIGMNNAENATKPPFKEMPLKYINIDIGLYHEKPRDRVAQSSMAKKQVYQNRKSATL
jgi:hypothetical protein